MTQWVAFDSEKLLKISGSLFANPYWQKQIWSLVAGTFDANLKDRELPELQRFCQKRTWLPCIPELQHAWTWRKLKRRQQGEMKVGISLVFTCCPPSSSHLRPAHTCSIQDFLAAQADAPARDLGGRVGCTLLRGEKDNRAVTQFAPAQNTFNFTHIFNFKQCQKDTVTYSYIHWQSS